MIKQVTLAVAAAGLALVSSGAIAREPSPVPAPKPAADVKTRYCIKSAAITGTMIEKRVCKTLEQWRAEGVDPTKRAN